MLDKVTATTAKETRRQKWTPALECRKKFKSRPGKEGFVVAEVMVTIT